MLLSCIVALLLSLSLGSLVKLEITLQTLVPEDKHSELQALIMGAYEAVLCRNPTGFYCYCFICLIRSCKTSGSRGNNKSPGQTDGQTHIKWYS
jgi:hypothetical protein